MNFPSLSNMSSKSRDLIRDQKNQRDCSRLQLQLRAPHSQMATDASLKLRQSLWKCVMLRLRAIKHYCLGGGVRLRQELSSERGKSMALRTEARNQDRGWECLLIYSFQLQFKMFSQLVQIQIECPISRSGITTKCFKVPTSFRLEQMSQLLRDVFKVEIFGFQFNFYHKEKLITMVSEIQSIERGQNGQSEQKSKVLAILVPLDS